MNKSFEVKSVVEQAYRSDLDFTKRNERFYLSFNSEEMDVTDLIKEHAFQIMNLTEEQIEDGELFPDLSYNAEFEVKSSSEQYGEIPGEPQVRSEERTMLEITSTTLNDCVFELQMGSTPLFKVNIDKLLVDSANLQFKLELKTVTEAISGLV